MTYKGVLGGLVIKRGLMPFFYVVVRGDSLLTVF